MCANGARSRSNLDSTGDTGNYEVVRHRDGRLADS